MGNWNSFGELYKASACSFGLMFSKKKLFLVKEMESEMLVQRRMMYFAHVDTYPTAIFLSTKRGANKIEKISERFI